MNKIEIELMNDDVSISCEEIKLVEEVFLKVLEIEQFSYDCYVDLQIVNEETIKLINQEQRQIDKVTDVLSFPSFEFDEEYKLVDEIESYDLDVTYNAILLGEIVICKPVSDSQADQYGHSKERELAFLVVHSMYHLLGYDHMEDKMKKDMRKKEEFALNELGILR